MRVQSHGWSFPSCGRILLDPDPAGLAAGGSASPEPVADAAPALDGGATRPAFESDGTPSAEPATTAPAGGTAPAPADPNIAAGQTNPSAPAGGADGWVSFRDAMRDQFGVDLSSHSTDQTALAYVAQQLNANKNADYYAQLGRSLAPHAQQFQTYLQQAAAPKVEAPKPWEPPQFDERWLGLVDLDPRSGMYVGKPGCPSEIVQGVNTYAKWRQDIERNPQQVFEPLITEQATKIARDIVRQELEGQAEKAAVAEIVKENAGWLYAKDNAGNLLVNQNGGRVLSPLGNRYQELIHEVAQAGVKDLRSQDRFAQSILRGEIMTAQQKQGSAAAASAANPQTQAAMARANMNALQLPGTPAGTMGATEPSPAGFSLHEQLRLAMAQAGVADSDFHDMGV